MKVLKFTGLLMALLGALALSGCSDHGDSGMTDPPPAGVSFAADIQPIFDTNCLGCHGVGGNGGLDLRPTESYANLVGVAATGYSGNRVEQGDAAASVLYQKLTASGGLEMPPGAPLPGSEHAKVAEWIEDGALEN